MYTWLFRKFFYPLYEQVIARRSTMSYVHEYSDNLNQSLPKLQEIQLNKLKKLLIHAYETCDYYKQQWDRLGFSPYEVSEVKDIEVLPLLDKSTISENYEAFISHPYINKNIGKATGGSSGEPFKFEYNPESDERRQAVMWRGYGWLNSGLGQRTLFLWGVNVKPVNKIHALKESLYHAFYNRKILNSFEMTEHNMMSYVDAINSRKPRAIVTYVNAITNLADYILTNKVKVYRPDTILTGAEPLYEFQREKIESAFGAPVYNTYGCREFMLVGAECGRQQGLHANIDHLVIELVGRDGKSEMSGDMVVTDLHNYGFPLIRYSNGDKATWADRLGCECRNPLPRLESIDGRKLDIIRTPDGKIILGEFFPHLIKDFPFVKKFQVVQNELDTVFLKLVFDHTNDVKLAELTSLVQQHLGELVTLIVEKVADIDLSDSGKLRVTVSTL